MCLEEYAEKLVEERKESNMYFILQFIRSEFSDPFIDSR